MDWKCKCGYDEALDTPVVCPACGTETGVKPVKVEKKKKRGRK